MFNFVCRSSFYFRSVIEIQKGVGFTPPPPLSLKGGLLSGASPSQELTKFKAKCKSIVS